jgi:ribosomal protein S28E/S33
MKYIKKQVTAAVLAFCAIFLTAKQWMIELRTGMRKLEWVPVKQRFGMSGAVVTVKSTLVTGRDALPAVIKNRILQRSEVLHARCIQAIANGDSVGSKYICFELPSNAVPVSVRISAPDIGTTTAADVGLYDTTANGSAVVDADFFKAAVVLNAGAIAKSEIVNGNVVTLANSEKRIWELLGLTKDSQKNYDVALTLTGAADAAGTILVEMDYVIG